MPITGEEVSLYFHIPFCIKKCPYCHFYSIINNPKFFTSFEKALISEWKKKVPLLQNKKIVSIYFGGGTPTLLSSHAIDALLSKIFKQANVNTSCEITIETNPEDVLLEKIKELKQLGINRTSLGVVSFDDQLLKMLGRNHSAKTAYQAIEAINNAGIDNLSIDLLYDIPKQTLKNWKNTLLSLKDLSITHLSLYNLTFEKNTAYYRRKKTLFPHLPKEEASLALLQEALDHLEKIGLKRYEISAFAKNNQVSQHNLGYWIGRPFLGFGPSAFSYWDQKRFSNCKNLDQYLKQSSTNSIVDFEEQLSKESHFRELLAIGLRVIKGIDLTVLEKKLKFHCPSVEQTLKSLINEGFLQKVGSFYKLTEKGLLFYDHVAKEII